MLNESSFQIACQKLFASFLNKLITKYCSKIKSIYVLCSTYCIKYATLYYITYAGKSKRYVFIFSYIFFLPACWCSQWHKSVFSYKKWINEFNLLFVYLFIWKHFSMFYILSMFLNRSRWSNKSDNICLIGCSLILNYNISHNCNFFGFSVQNSKDLIS